MTILKSTFTLTVPLAFTIDIIKRELPDNEIDILAAEVLRTVDAVINSRKNIALMNNKGYSIIMGNWRLPKLYMGGGEIAEI